MINELINDNKIISVELFKAVWHSEPVKYQQILLTTLRENVNELYDLDIRMYARAQTKKNNAYKTLPFNTILKYLKRALAHFYDEQFYYYQAKFNNSKSRYIIVKDFNNLFDELVVCLNTINYFKHNKGYLT